MVLSFAYTIGVIGAGPGRAGKLHLWFMRTSHHGEHTSDAAAEIAPRASQRTRWMDHGRDLVNHFTVPDSFRFLGRLWLVNLSTRRSAWLANTLHLPGANDLRMSWLVHSRRL